MEYFFTQQFLVKYNQNHLRWNKKLFFNNSLVIGAIIGAILSFELKDFIVILVTSIMGSYIITRGLSLVFGNFQSELDVYYNI